MSRELSFLRLQAALAGELPGHADLAALNGYPRSNPEEARQLRPLPKESAVLAVLFPVAGATHLLLMKRAVYHGVHSGQIAFPGGKIEPGDADLQATALREFAEETGADPAPLRVAGALSPVYIPPSRTVVSPFVAWADAMGPFRPDPREVDRLFAVPMQQVLADDALRQKPIRMAHGQEVMAAYWDLGGEVVWGATALMIAELRALLGTPLPGLR